MNTLDPVILFFLLGLAAGLLKSELRLPPAIYEFLSVVLLIAIGLKGGVELSKQSFGALAGQIGLVLLLGFTLPLLAFPVLRWVGKLPRADAASIAAHYGSVSVATYAAASAWMTARGISYEEYMPLFVVLLEVPAIIVGIMLARGVSRDTRWGKLGHEIFLGKGIVLLAGGLIIGWVAGPVSIAPVGELFFGLFKGVLALFLLEMGLIAAAQAGNLRRHGLFLGAFAVGMPLVSACIGIGLGALMGLTPGGVAVLATLAASASYIAVPAAMRIAVPEANPALSLAAALGVTFPFNVLVGIPLYHRLAEALL